MKIQPEIEKKQAEKPEEMEEEITIDKTEMDSTTGKWVTTQEVVTIGEYDMSEMWKFGQQQGELILLFVILNSRSMNL